MKRRILALALLLALLLTGCGGGKAPAETDPPPAAADTPAPTRPPKATPAPTPAPPEEDFPYDYEELLADTDDFSLAVTALGVDRQGDWIVHLRLENRSREVMSFRFLYQSINGLAIDEVLEYRVAVGGTLEPRFRILREEMAAWGFERPVQWGFTLRVSSADDPEREPCFFEELSASPFGAREAVRYEFVPGPLDALVMDNDYAAVYVTGWELSDEGLSIEYVAVSRCGQPLLLVLPEGEVLLDGKACPAELGDSFGAYATLMGYIPVPGWTAEHRPERLDLTLALADPSQWGDPPIEDTEESASITAK